MIVAYQVHDLVEGFLNGNVGEAAFLDQFEELRGPSRQTSRDLYHFTILDMLVTVALLQLTPTCDLAGSLVSLTRV